MFKGKFWSSWLHPEVQVRYHCDDARCEHCEGLPWPDEEEEDLPFGDNVT